MEEAFDTAVVAGTRVPVMRLWAWHRKGVLIETLIKRYPSLTPAKILSALSFAYDNQERMARELAREATLHREVHPVPGAMTQMKLPLHRPE